MALRIFSTSDFGGSSKGGSVAKAGSDQQRQPIQRARVNSRFMSYLATLVVVERAKRRVAGLLLAGYTGAT